MIGLRWLTMMAIELDWELVGGRADVERTSCAWSGGRLPWLGDRSIDGVELECRSRSRQQLSLSDGECSIVIDSMMMMMTTGSISRGTNSTVLFASFVWSSIQSSLSLSLSLSLSRISLDCLSMCLLDSLPWLCTRSYAQFSWHFYI